MKKRLKVPSARYHVFNRGVDGRDMFIDDQDRFTFHKILIELIVEKHLKFTCHAYSEMDNHFHLLLETFNEDISTVIYFLCFKYAKYFNQKYGRKGYLFQNSFESRLIFDNHHFKVVQAYIHNNWKEAHRPENMNNMLYCSYQCFIKQKTIFSHLDIEKSLTLYSNKKEDAIKEFQGYTKQAFNKKNYQKYQFSDLLFLILEITKKRLDDRWIIITYLLKNYTNAKYTEIFEILRHEESAPLCDCNTYRRMYLRKIQAHPKESLSKFSQRLRGVSHPSPGLG